MFGTSGCHFDATWVYEKVRCARSGRRAPPALTVPAWPPHGLPPPCPQPRTPRQPPGPLAPAQRCHKRASLQLPMAWPCPDMGPDESGPPVGPCPSLASTHPHPQGGAQCLGLGLPQCPPAALLCFVQLYHFTRRSTCFYKPCFPHVLSATYLQQFCC